MALSCSFHRPLKAVPNVFESHGEMHGSVKFLDNSGAEIAVYTTPAAAKAIADAFNAAIAEPAAIAAE